MNVYKQGKDLYSSASRSISVAVLPEVKEQGNMFDGALEQVFLTFRDSGCTIQGGDIASRSF